MTGHAKMPTAAAAHNATRAIIGPRKSDCAIASTDVGSNAKPTTSALNCSVCFNVARFTLHRPLSVESKRTLDGAALDSGGA